MSEELVICGVLIHAVPGTAKELVTELRQIPGTEVHHQTEDGRLIVTVESDDRKRAGDVLIQIQSLSGVASASLVYNHFEEIANDEVDSDETDSDEIDRPELETALLQEMRHETEQA